VRSDGRSYILRLRSGQAYDWSNRGQLLKEWTEGLAIRTFEYNAAGQMITATVFTLTTRFKYNGDGARLAVEVVDHGTTTYTLDYGRGSRILAENTLTGTALVYLYPSTALRTGGHDCIGQYDNPDDGPALSGAEGWLYYLNDAPGYVHQSTDEQGEVTPDGTLLEGPEGPVSHLICGGVYDWSTGLIFKSGGCFVPRYALQSVLPPLAQVL